jgi:hypothetical protein
MGILTFQEDTGEREISKRYVSEISPLLLVNQS